MRTPDRIDPNIWDDVERLREWTFDQLHRADLADLKMREAEDYPLDPRRSLTWHRLMEYYKADEDIRVSLVRCKRNDPDHYYQIITDSPGLRGYVQPRRGRRKGNAPGIAEARSEIADIRQLWKQAFGKSYKKGRPYSLAVEIAAERHGFTPHELDNYRKNRTPSQRI
jgi:hypothetical protein